MAQTADKIGNVNRAPFFAVKAETRPNELIFSYSRLTQKGVTLKSGQGVLLAGTPLKKDAATNLTIVDTSPGTSSCRGLLRDDVDTGTVVTDPPHFGNIVLAGVVRASVVTAANAAAPLAAAALTALGGRLDAQGDNGAGVIYFGG